MDKQTYANTDVANYVIENYYAVKLDVEFKDAILWLGNTYRYNAKYKSHGLAILLLSGYMSYPSTIFMPTIQSMPAVLAGYLKPNEIAAPLHYFADGAMKTQTFVDFNQLFKNKG
jgi:thioredoxin-related protein